MSELQNNPLPPARRRHNFGKPTPPSQRGYGKDHRRLRRALLKDSPMCVTGCGRAATVADHVKAMCLGGATDASNLQAMCEPCHRSKSGREGAYVRWHVRPGLARNGRAKVGGR